MPKIGCLSKKWVGYSFPQDLGYPAGESINNTQDTQQAGSLLRDMGLQPSPRIKCPIALLSDK